MVETREGDKEVSLPLPLGDGRGEGLRMNKVFVIWGQRQLLVWCPD